MSLFRRVADNREDASWATRLRRRRFDLFLQLLAEVPRPVRILDIGGTQDFWEMMGFAREDEVEITLLNLEIQPVRHRGFRSMVGDATDLTGLGDASFDVVFSNSVIEHVGSYEAQRRMAAEVQRVGRRYFVQTPNYFFPIEPHFLFPGFQWLPIGLRAWLINHWKLGWIDRIPDRERAREFVRSIRLLRKAELMRLFPRGRLYEEKVLGLTKSFVAHGGF